VLPAPLLYLTNGLDDAGCDCGIHVLEVRDAAGGGACLPSAPCVARRVDRSTNGSGPFNFQFDPTAPYYEEPEGITFWDLDADPRSPGVSGQVHVILLDNDEPDSDDVYVKHYRLGTETEPPAVTCPADVVVECTGDGGIRRDDPQLAGFLGGATAEDACDAAPAVANDVPALLPLGTTPVTFTATDDFGNAASCVASVTVVDTASPTVQVSLSPHHLWPPNHKMVEVTATVIMADGCDPAPSFVLSSVASSEPDDGRGDGHTGGDIQGVALGTPDTSFLVRAERAGGGPGRIYAATFSAFDGTGNGAAAAGTAIVSKP
jgi:hypothetical protein